MIIRLYLVSDVKSRFARRMICPKKWRNKEMVHHIYKCENGTSLLFQRIITPKVHFVSMMRYFFGVRISKSTETRTWSAISPSWASQQNIINNWNHILQIVMMLFMLIRKWSGKDEALWIPSSFLSLLLHETHVKQQAT